MVSQARKMMCSHARDAAAHPELVGAVRLENKGAAAVLVAVVVGEGEQVVPQLPDGDKLGVGVKIHPPRPPPKRLVQRICRGEGAIPRLHINQGLPL